jgi:hypothetical protein
MRSKRLLPILSLCLLFTACMKEKAYKTYTIHRPEYSLKPGIKERARLQKPEPLKQPGGFVLYKNTMFINERDRGLHVIDYNNPGQPVNRGFIPIPGNLGVAIKDDILYADSYCDLFVFKISTNENIQLHNSVQGVFASRLEAFHNDTSCVTVTWINKDTTVPVNANIRPEMFMAYNYDASGISSQNLQNSNVPRNNTSVGSSLAVFTIVQDHLYTVDRSNLHAFSLRDALSPTLENKQPVNLDVETIFPFKDKLFIGTMTGMFIYSIEDPARPAYISQFNHARVCDPVIADDQYAFVTLRSGNPCGGFTNQLDVIDIGTITRPKLLRSFPFSNPHGLSKDGNVLFVCDGQAGLRVIDASDPGNLVTKQVLNIGTAIDVVAHRQIAFVTLDNAIRLYAYDQQFQVQPLGVLLKN